MGGGEGGDCVGRVNILFELLASGMWNMWWIM